MLIQPTAEPFSAPARPDLTDGRKIGVLVSHGFTGSPASMRPWAESLAERGFAVELPLLPGHGTRWPELNKVGWRDWVDTLNASFDKLRAENDAVVVCGLSLGGALALRLAADRPDEVAGVVVVNPAVNTTRLDVKALPVLRFLVGAFPGIVNDIKKPGQDEYGYPKTPLKAAYSMMWHGWKPLRADLAKITSPILLFKSAEDHVVDETSLAIIKKSVSSREFTEVSLPESYHVATLDNDAPQIFNESADFIARVTAG
ncbi:MAG: alpha/beta fold hydrolase [Nocardioides sp.]|uniref:alpha/beta hydrolase n=1 Tax=Nocardioides sp. TaxID=35761 RepID=UPI00326728DF